MRETDRLILRPWRVSDAVIQHELWTERDPRVPPHRRLSADGHPSVTDLKERIRTGSQPGLLAVELRSTGEVIGYCGVIPRDGSDEPELAYELLQRFWGQGYATEATRAVIGSVRDHQRLWASVRDWNTASRRVLAKLGFVETGQVEPDAVHGNSLLTVLEL
ncbi:N-acetyltransferase [Glaciihabitans arcticus]|uniref:N-acetyltransferase n=1 Tax=Glaciihabitans arcticus TaxID=2668039 RepID=A0A4Q9GSM7_9MICO|nr:GNAT family N-acetyltransferase [Glaciihabitans arcticus]TBN56618.1 N-acetyltransferase [Glaciihabitans arcticus]